MPKRKPPRPKSLKGLKGGLREYWKKKGVPETAPRANTGAKGK